MELECKEASIFWSRKLRSQTEVDSMTLYSSGVKWRDHVSFGACKRADCYDCEVSDLSTTYA